VDYKLFAVRVCVTDWERAIRFYRETLEMAIAYRSDEIPMSSRRTTFWPRAASTVSAGSRSSHGAASSRTCATPTGTS